MQEDDRTSHSWHTAAAPSYAYALSALHYRFGFCFPIYIVTTVHCQRGYIAQSVLARAISPNITRIPHILGANNVAHCYISIPFPSPFHRVLICNTVVDARILNRASANHAGTNCTCVAEALLSFRVPIHLIYSMRLSRECNNY